MSVRHIHAKPGEYIAVHRRHGGGSGNGEGWIGLFTFIFVILLVVFLWKILVALTILGAVLWLVWIFRRPIWNFACWLFVKSGGLLAAGYQMIQARCSRRKNARMIWSSSEFQPGPDYGKIRQYRR